MPGPLPDKRKAPFKWTDSKIAAAILEYLDSLDAETSPTLAGYKRFRRTVAPHLPSVLALKARGGRRILQQTRAELIQQRESDS
jgi:hypothetical protein